MTATYKAGTVSTTANNAVVTGTGTAWAVALVVGGIFSCAGMAVPIASVDSDTQITLDYNWPGTTASGRSYSIARENSDAANVVDFYDKLSELLVTLSIAGIHPDNSGSLAKRDALTLNASNDNYLYLRAELGVAFAFYRWDGPSLTWIGPFPVASATTTAAGVQSIAPGTGITVDNTNPNIPVIKLADGGGVQGDILFRGATNWQRLAKGSALQVLRQNTALTAPEWGSVREVLTANRNYYVRKDGNDANTGLVDNAGGAFLTIQKAVNVAAALDLSIYTVAINVRAGTYAENVSLRTYLGGAGNGITVIGDTVTPSNVIIAGSNTCFTASQILGLYTLQGMRLAPSAGHCLQISGGSLVNYGQLEFGALTSTGSHIVCFAGAIATCIAAYSIIGSAFRHFWCESGGFTQVAGITVTLTGTPAFSNCFAYANMGAVIQANANTFTGTATGQRYQITANSLIYTGAAVTTLPGNVAGAVASGGQYL